METAKQLIDELYSRFDISESEIAKKCFTSQATINRIRNGAVSECGSILYVNLTLLVKKLRRSNKKAA
jgi:predicted transcriptional regulator